MCACHQDWEDIFTSIYTDAIITNPHGIIIYANDSTKYWFGLDKEKMVGKSVYELENQKVFSPSITRLVLETMKKQTTIQETQTGKKLLVTGDVIRDENNNLKNIICYAQDITELEHLKKLVKDVEQELQQTKMELNELQHNQVVHPLIVARSDNMQRVKKMLKKVAPTDAVVLLTGESGVGKSMLADYIHQESTRRGQFIKIDCGSIPEPLLESELFGYEPGAFTGANRSGKKGVVEEAKDGTLFLDEIGEISLSLQTKLLTLIQDKKFYRIGNTKPQSVNFRLIAATNADLEEKIKKKQFREDLYFRLAVIQAEIPPLRERQEDLIDLVKQLLLHFNKKYSENKVLSQTAYNDLLRYEWRGNIRELSNVMEKLVLTTEENEITTEHIPDKIKSISIEESFTNIFDHTLPELLQKKEQEVLHEAMNYCSTTTEIAALLGISQPTVVRKLQKYKYEKSLYLKNTPNKSK